MATLIPLASYVRVRQYCYAPTISQVGINTSYWQCKTIITGGCTDRELAQTMGALFVGPYRALMPATARYSSSGVSLMKPVPSNITLTSEVRDISWRTPGTAAGNLSPKQVSLVLSFKSGLAAKHQNGRVFPPFPAASLFDSNGEVTNAAVLLLVALGTQYDATVTCIGATGTGTFELVVKGVQKQVRPLPDIASYVDVNTVIARQATGTQRRRSDFGRLNSEPNAV